MPFEMWEIAVLVVLGLAAGVLGGLLGIGGSVVMIPVLTLLLGRNQHLSQAAAMIVNVFVAVPAVIRHHRERIVPWPMVVRMLPAGLVFIVIGVESSNRLDANALMRVFGVFLLYVIAVNVIKLLRPGAADDEAESRTGWLAASGVAAVTGFAAGLLGIGGGVIAVPLLQRIARLPLRTAIATSSALMCLTATVGAARKNFTLPEIADAGPWDGVVIAAVLAPTAIIGGYLGAHLTHVLPLRLLRIVFVLLLAVACYRFLA